MQTKRSLVPKPSLTLSSELVLHIEGLLGAELTHDRSQGDGQAGFLRKLAAEIMDHNSNQHRLTQSEAKIAAREQVGFNIAGYLDDFSKALSVRVFHLCLDTSLRCCARRGRFVLCLTK